MTLYHFGNCLALAYIPYFITYKYSGLSEYGAFWKCVQAGGVYALTQLAKMLILATFFPSLDAGDGSQLSILSEFLRCTVDLADLCGLSFVMSRVAGKGNTKILVAGVGWAAAEFIFSKLAILWFGARGTEFNIMYIQKSLESNISLVHFLALTTLVWLSSRNDLPRQFFPAVVLLILLATYEPLLLHVLAPAMSSWTLFLLFFITVFRIRAFAIATTLIYYQLTHLRLQNTCYNIRTYQRLNASYSKNG
nr:EOG090X0CTK [Triops cancriformis]